MKLSKIYKLIDPRDNSPKYVGKTTRTLNERLHGHWSSRKRSTVSPRLKAWLNELDVLGMKPRIELIEEAIDYGLHKSKWIERLTKEGHRLLNTVSLKYSRYVPHPSCVFYNAEQEAKLNRAYPDAHVLIGQPLTPRRTSAR